MKQSVIKKISIQGLSSYSAFILWIENQWYRNEAPTPSLRLTLRPTGSSPAADAAAAVPALSGSLSLSRLSLTPAKGHSLPRRPKNSVLSLNAGSAATTAHKLHKKEKSLR